MEPHGFLSGKCKHGSSNFCTLCDIEGHPERYTEKLLLEVVHEIIEAARVPVSFEVGTRLMVWYAAQQSVRSGSSMSSMADYVYVLQKTAQQRVHIAAVAVGWLCFVAGVVIGKILEAG